MGDGNDVDGPKGCVDVSRLGFDGPSQGVGGRNRSFFGGANLGALALVALLAVVGVALMPAAAGAVAEGPAVAQVTPTADEDPSVLAGSGTQDDPYVITNASDFTRIDGDRDAHYVLGSDVDLAGANVTMIAESEYYEPPSRSDSFNGTLDGDGHAIRNLAIDERGAALFATVGAAGAVEDLRIVDADVTGEATLAVANRGEIRNVDVSGTVDGDAAGATAVAGLVQHNDDTGTVRNVSANVVVDGDGAGSFTGAAGVVGDNEGRVLDVTVTGHVEAGGDASDVGGVVGFNEGLVRNATTDARVEGGDHAGGVVGHNDEGHVVSVRATGNVSGDETVGGLVGELDGEANASVTDSVATGDVAGVLEVGGLVGHASAQVRRSAATGDVTASRPTDSQAESFGGLVGELSANVTDAYATGDVDGVVDVGGLVGTNFGHLDGAYATGAVDGRDRVGPVDGSRSSFGPDAVAVYWNADRPTSPANATGVGLTTAEMTGDTAAETMDGLAFGDGWQTTAAYPVLAHEDADSHDGPAARIEADATRALTTETVAFDATASRVFGGEVSSYEWTVSGETVAGDSVTATGTGPTFEHAFEEAGHYTVTATVVAADGRTDSQDVAVTVDQSIGALDGSGTAADPYRIETATDLLAVRHDRTAHYVLSDDVDASGTAEWRGGDGFPSIQSSLRWGLHFNGTFDGQGHAIEGLTVDEHGLFRGIQPDGRVEDLHLRDAEIDADNESGLLAGTNEGTIRNVTVTGETDVIDETGGLVATNEGLVRNVSTNVTVEGDGYVGGVAGENHGRIVDATASGDVDGGDYSHVGGLVGSNQGVVRDASATGDVRGDDEVGGLVGAHYGGGEITRAYATGEVTAEFKVGGLVGDARANVTATYATGDVSGSDEVGGLVGRVTPTIRIERSYSAGGVILLEDGFVLSQRNIGGLVGAVNGLGGDDVAATSYYDVQSAGQEPGAGETGLTTDEMTGETVTESMSAFDFGDTWTTTEGYPTLSSVGGVVPVDDDEGDADHGDGPTVSVEPGWEEVDVDRTVERRIVMDEAPDGVSGYRLDVEVENASVAGITDAHAGRYFSLNRNMTMADDGSAVSIRAADLESAVEPSAGNVTLANVTLRTERPGETDVTVDVVGVDADGGGMYDTRVEGATLSVVDVPEVPSVSLELDSDRVGLGGQTKGSLVLSNAPKGVSGYRLTVSVENGSVASIDNASAADEFGLTRNATISDDGSTASLRAIDLEDTIQPGATDVRLANVTFAGEAPGETDVGVTIHNLDADGGDLYDTDVEDVPLSVVNVTVAPIDGNVPQDVDGDWKYEDINGNGRLDSDDVVVLFEELFAPAVTDHYRAFDYNGNQRMDFDDVIVLFEML